MTANPAGPPRAKLPLKRLLLLATISAVGVFLWFMNEGIVKKEDKGQSVSSAADAPGEGNGSTDEALGLALREMKLTQGEKGAELWRLKASWANMLESNGEITMESPQLVYFMPPDNKELFVVAEKGDVNQKSQILRFVGKVRASQGNSTLTGDLLVYNGTARTMVFPDGGVFHGNKFSGKAAVVMWRMQDQIIEGSGGVSVVIDSAPPLRKLIEGKSDGQTNAPE